MVLSTGVYGEEHVGWMKAHDNLVKIMDMVCLIRFVDHSLSTRVVLQKIKILIVPAVTTQQLSHVLFSSPWGGGFSSRPADGD